MALVIHKPEDDDDLNFDDFCDVYLSRRREGEQYFIQVITEKGEEAMRLVTGAGLNVRRRGNVFAFREDALGAVCDALSLSDAFIEFRL